MRPQASSNRDEYHSVGGDALLPQTIHCVHCQEIVSRYTFQDYAMQTLLPCTPRQWPEVPFSLCTTPAGALSLSMGMRIVNFLSHENISVLHVGCASVALTCLELFTCSCSRRFLGFMPLALSHRHWFVHHVQFDDNREVDYSVSKPFLNGLESTCRVSGNH